MTNHKLLLLCIAASIGIFCQPLHAYKVAPSSVRAKLSGHWIDESDGIFRVKHVGQDFIWFGQGLRNGKYFLLKGKGTFKAGRLRGSWVHLAESELFPSEGDVHGTVDNDGNIIWQGKGFSKKWRRSAAPAKPPTPVETPESIINGPRPWEHARVQQLMDEWLTISTPLVKPIKGWAWRWESWGRFYNGLNVRRPTQPPTTNKVRYHYLWDLSTKLASVRHYTLREYLERRLRGESGVQDKPTPFPADDVVADKPPKPERRDLFAGTWKGRGVTQTSYGPLRGISWRTSITFTILRKGKGYELTRFTKYAKPIKGARPGQKEQKVEVTTFAAIDVRVEADGFNSTMSEEAIRLAHKNGVTVLDENGQPIELDARSEV